MRTADLYPGGLGTAVRVRAAPDVNIHPALCPGRRLRPVTAERADSDAGWDTGASVGRPQDQVAARLHAHLQLAGLRCAEPACYRRAGRLVWSYAGP
jgi:hypothetical protein